MRKRAVRFTAAALVICMLVQMLTMLGTAAESDLLFSDNFNAGKLDSGWQSSVGTVSDGAYVLTNGQFNTVKSIGNRDSMMISANVTVTQTSPANGSGMLMLYTDSSGSRGYEFGIAMSKAGVTMARVYLRGNDDETRILYQNGYDDSTEAKNDKLVYGEKYHLAIGAKDGRVACYLNHVMIFETQDTTFSKGTVGVRAEQAKAVFDDVTVTKIGEKKVKSLEVKNASQTISPYGIPNFNLIVHYTNSFYSDEQLTPDSPGVTVSGLDGKPGNKSVKVNYSGVSSAAFTVKVVSGYKNTLFSDDFSKDTDSWTLSAPRNLGGEGNLYDFGIKNGRLQADYPKKTGDFNSSTGHTATLKSDVFDGWRSFRMKIQACITGDATTSSPRPGTVQMRLCSVDGTALRLKVMSSGLAQLYYGSEQKLSIKLDGFKMGQVFTMAMEYYYGGIIAGYFNDKLLFLYTDADEASCKIDPVLNIMEGSGWIDNVVVTEIEPKNPQMVKSLKLLDGSTGKTATTFTGSVLYMDSMYLSVTYNDGSTIPVRIRDYMISGYSESAKKNQTVRITYGSKSCTLAYKYTPYLFFDDFNGGISPLWNLPNTVGYTVSNDRNGMHFIYDPDKAASTSLRANVKNGNWKNVAVSVDFSFDARDARNQMGIGLFARRGGGNNDYEFRLTYTSTHFEGVLYRHNQGKAAKAVQRATYGTVDATTKNGVMRPGGSYNLQMVLKSNVILIYLDGKLLCSAIDNDEDAILTPGNVGVVGWRGSFIIDNFMVDSRGESNPVNLSISGLKDNTFVLYEGQEIFAPDYSVKVLDADGSTAVLPLSAEDISPYDNMRLGTQNIVISMMGKKLSAKVTVKERHAEIKSLNDELEGLNPSSLALTDKEKIDGLKKRYDALSGYEVTLLSKTAREKLEQAIAAIEALEFPELADYPVIFTDDFSDSTNPYQWGSTGLESIGGEWNYSNATYYWQKLESGGASMVGPRNFSGKIVSVEADMKMLQGGGFTGLNINVCGDGYYMARVYENSVDKDGKPRIQTQIYKKTYGTNRLVSSSYPDLKGVTIKSGEWFHIKVTFINNAIHLFLNGKEVDSYNDEGSDQIFTEGNACIRPGFSDALIDNFRVRGTLSEVGEPYDPEKYITPTNYKDDFEDEKVGSNPSHWVEVNTVDYWKVYSESGSKVYGTKYRGGDTYTWLHVAELNPSVTMRFMARNPGANAKAGLIFRMSPQTTFMRIGYDFAQKKWYLQSERNIANYDTDYHYAEKTSTFKNGHWYNLEITVREQKAVVKADGETVLEVNDFLKEGFGHVGVFATGAETYVDDVNYTFPNGDIPQDGLIEYSTKYIRDVWSECLEIEVLPNGDLVGATRSGGVLYSNNKGQTFTNADESGHAEYLSIRCNGPYPTMLKLRNGKYIKSRTEKDGIYIDESSDMITWKQIGTVIADSTSNNSGTKYINHVNHMTEVDMGNGKYRLFFPIAHRTVSGAVVGHYTVAYYSDDGGKTWTASTTPTYELDPGYNPSDTAWTWAEAKVIGCKDGTVRMYYSRNKWGCMQYTVSKDGGATWEGLYQIPEMQCPLSSYAIYEDPYERGTYYMVWVNDTAKGSGDFLPRRRISLVRSYDGMNWEFLMDVQRTGTYMPSDPKYKYEFNEITQVLDESLAADDKYLYITFGFSEEKSRPETNSGHHEQRPYFVRVEKDKLKAREWDASTISDYRYPKTMELTEQPQTKFGLNDLYVLNGGAVTLTGFNGEKTVVPLDQLYCWDKVNTYQKGETTVRYYYVNRSYVEVKYSVVDRYKVTWNVSEGGTVKEPPASVLDGDPLTAELQPDKGFKVGQVLVNGKKVNVNKNTFTTPEAHGDLEITVTFERSIIGGGSNWWIYLIIGGVVILLAGGGVLAFFLIKKKKKSTSTDLPSSSDSSDKPTSDSPPDKK